VETDHRPLRCICIRNHDLGHPDGVRIAGPAPRQVAGVGGEPWQQGGNNSSGFGLFQGGESDGQVGVSQADMNGHSSRAILQCFKLQSCLRYVNALFMGTPATPSNSETQSESPAPKSGALSILGEVSQYTILAAFALYVIGFVIWQTYLGDYGISSLSLLQTEYFSAALCFLGFFLYFGFPTALIYLNWFRKKYVKSTDENKFWTIESVPMGLFLWTSVSICYRLLFSAFDNHSHEIIRRIAIPSMVIFILSSIAWLVLYVKLKEKKSKWADILKNKLNPGYAIFFGFFLLTLVELLMQKENLDQLYFMMSVCFTALVFTVQNYL